METETVRPPRPRRRPKLPGFGRSTTETPARRRSLHARLAASHFLVASAALLVVALWLPRATERYEIASLERQLASEAWLVRRLAQPLMAASRPDAVQLFTRQVGRDLGARVTLIDARGRVLGDSLHDPATMENHATRPEIRAALRLGLGQSQRYSRTLGMERLYVAVPVWGGQGSGVRGVVRLSLSLAQVHRYVRQIRGALFFSLLLAVLAAVGLSLLLSRSLTRPLRLLRNAALGWSQGEVIREVALSSRDEIGELAEAFDQMATRLKGTIAELAADRSQMRAVLNTMLDGLLVTDAAGQVRLLNPAAARLLGVSGAAPSGKTVLDLTLDATLQAMVDDVLRTGVPAACERALRTPAERVLAVSAVPISPHPSLLRLGVVLVLHDLTDTRRVERMRRDFVANASHELRTPLASMRIMVETLLDGAREDPDAAQHFLQILDRELQRMTALVNDLLELSRLDARGEAAPTQSVALAPLAAELEAGWQAVADARGLRLEVSVPEGLAVTGEVQGMRQILNNLLDNALKYTPPGGRVRLHAQREGESIILEVSDTGLGIPVADQDRIFERFYRVDRDRSRDLGGTGLGLSIAKHLVQSYGGRITVESCLNRGSTFRVTLPLATHQEWGDVPSIAGTNA